MADTYTSSHTLEIVQAAATIIIDQKAIEHNFGGIKRYINTILPMQCENAVLSMLELFAADRIEDVVIRYPANWWEHLKEATAPQIVLDRWPVKYRRVVVEVKAIWQGYQPPAGWERYGPLLPYVMRKYQDDTEDM